MKTTLSGNKKLRLLNQEYPSYFIIPAALIFVIFFVIPVLLGFGYSLTNWNLSNPNIKFVGIDQYRELILDERFVTAIKNTALFAVLATLLQNIIGLVLALVMSQKLKSREFLQTIFFLPCILSVLIIGYAFKAILAPDGVLNNVLNSAGLSALTADWLNAKKLGLLSVIMVNVWMVMGFNMTIFLTGIKNIPSPILEAAVIDGVTPWKKFTKIIFPMLAPSLTINVLMNFVGGMKVFDLVFSMTKGGPGYQTEVINTLVYRIFGQGRFGYGTAVSVVLFLLITIMSLFILRYLRKREVEM